MKKLFLVRHAKSSWSEEKIADIDRPLNGRGYRDAHQVSEYLREAGCLPDYMVSSSAIRALTTALIFSRTFKFPEEQIRLTSKLYESGQKDYFEVIGSIPDKYATIFLFAHNFTISGVAEILTGENYEEMPTCAVMEIHFKMKSWKEIEEGRGKRELYIFPQLIATL